LSLGCVSAQCRLLDDLEEPTTVKKGERPPPVETENEDDEEDEGDGEEEVKEPDVKWEEPDLEAWEEENEDKEEDE
jgi:hypothetical protein